MFAQGVGIIIAALEVGHKEIGILGLLIGLGVSCSADRNIKCKINKDGIWIEKMDDKPGELIPAALREAGEGDVVKIDLNQPMADILKELTKYPVATRLSLNGTIILRSAEQETPRPIGQEAP